MFTLIEPLKWDSEFFGLPIGRITPTSLDGARVATLLAEAEETGMRCLYFEARADDPDTVALAERHGFHLVDVRVVLEHPFHNRPAPIPRYSTPAELLIDLPKEAELGRLQEISAQIGLTSRFHFDKNFGPEQSKRLYCLWIKNACSGFAGVVFIARWHSQGEAVGLISCTIRENIAHIQLAGVHSDHRQRGVGTGLVQAGLEWAKSHGAKAMQVVTQARNVPAQRLYQQMGFFTRSMTLYYHKWL